MKVKATGEFKRRGVYPVELGGTIPEEGTEFEVSDERFAVLSGNNSYNAKFVEAVGQPDIAKPVEEVETAKKEVAAEKAVKTTKKTTKTATKKVK